MNATAFTHKALKAAIGRGVGQCVVIGARHLSCEAFQIGPDTLRLFTVGEETPSILPAIFVRTDHTPEALDHALKASGFNREKPSVFVWLGRAKYRTVDAVLRVLGFIASLPRGSAVVFDYAPERMSSLPQADTALDALASRITLAGGIVKHFIRPQAVATLLGGLGFENILDLAQDGLALGSVRLVSAAL